MVASPHLLPKYIPDKLVELEIAYQMVEARIIAFQDSNSKRLWPRIPITVGTQTLLNVPHANKEA
jgi:hypothetical protein